MSGPWKIAVGVMVIVCSGYAPLTAAQSVNDFLKQPVMAEATVGARATTSTETASLDGFTPAPMPDIDRSAPALQGATPGAARLAPRLFHKQATYHGEGYVFGSTVQEEQDRRVTPAPGINLIMPLQ